MIYTRFFTRVLIAALMFSLCGIPELVAQTTQTNNATAGSAQTQGQTNSGNQGSSTDPRFSGVKPDPSAGPQTPTLTPQVPESPSPVQPQQEQQLPTAPAPQVETSTQPAQTVTQRENPAGAATAEKGVTRGGAASKPAGTAIAPAKQRQVRSLLIKLGVVAAAGVAVGTVMGLSKGSPTSPPGAPKASTASR